MQPLQLSQASGVPFYRQLQDQLAALIQSGSLTAESQLPSVRQLASDTLVSLITVRRAYANLEAAGLVERRQGQGTFVKARVCADARAQGRAQGRALLTEAVGRARQLGLSDTEQRDHLQSLWTPSTATDGAS